MFVDKLIVEACYWGEEEYIITVRPQNSLSWQGMPIGCTLSENEARIVAQWLSTSVRELQKIALHVEKRGREE